MKKIITRYKKSLVFLLLCASAFVALPFIKVSASGTISGRVFQDYNGNGVFDTAGTITGSNPSPAVDVGVVGITVTIYDASGTAQGSVISGANGTYSIAAGGTGPYRVEFTTLPTGYFPSANSNGSLSATTAGSTVQFVNNGTTGNVNLAINNSDDYCQNNPSICVNQYVSGNTTSSSNPTIVRVPYNTGTAPVSVANNNNVGSTWGLAYSKNRKQIYSAAFLKRHVGLNTSLTNSAEGRLGAIYVSNAFASPNKTDFTDIPNVGTIANDATRGLGSPSSPSQDANVYNLIGKVGLGDIELSQDENTLYAVNLNNKRLYSIPINPTIGNAGTQQNVAIPNGSNPGCVDGEWRPFALGRRRGVLYVGGICDASTSTATTAKSKLQAIVYRVNVNTSFPATTFTEVLRYSLDFTKGTPFGSCNGGWFAWTTSNTIPSNPSCTNRTAYPQPILSDIEFDNDGSMIMGFIDRFGHQVGFNNVDPNGVPIPSSKRETIGGDILRAHLNTSGNFVLENNGAAGLLLGAQSQTPPQGPGGGEFYHGDNYPGLHFENSEGGLAMMPGAGDVVLSFMDPVALNTSGIAWLRNTNGTKNKGYDLTGNFGKANGVGDVELLCDLAPIEIGNRVWRDDDGDGIQDADEPGIGNVSVQLFQGSALVGVAITNASGEYYFTSASGTSSGNAQYNLNIQPNTAYQIRLGNPSNYLIGGSLFNRYLTTANVGSNDSIDSDATNITISGGTVPVINFTTGNAGANDHTFDIGFRTPYIPDNPENCGTQGKICFDIKVPQKPIKVPPGNITGTATITIQRYQNGAIISPPITKTYTADGKYCIEGSELLAGITGDFDWSAVVTYQLPGTTIPPTIIGQQATGVVQGQNNDFKKECKNCCGIGKNLVRNGDFNRREETFESIYRANSELFPSQFWIGNSEDAKNACRNWEINGHSKCDDPKDNFLMVNGRTTQIGATPAVVWSQEVKVEGGSEYEFCAFFKDLKQCCFNKQPEITMKATINGNVITQNATISTGNKRCDWQLVSTKINVPAGVSSINLEILLNENVNGDGNDVAIDDISLTKKPNLPNNETQFLWSQQTYTDDTHYTVAATPTKTQKPDCKYIWTAVELDASNNPNLSTKRTWTIPPANTGAFTFGGFPGASGTSPGIFEVGKTYEFAYRAECDCSNPQTTVQRHFVGFPTNIMVKPTKGTPVPKNLIRISEVRLDRNPTN